MLPPGPRLPAPAQTVLMAADPPGFLARCAERYGETFTLHVAGIGPVVLSASPARLQELFTGDPEVLRGGNDILLPVAGRHSLLTLDGPVHARHRKLMLPPLHGSRMRAYGRLIQEEARAALAGWAPGTTVSVLPAMQRVSLEVILRAVFGIADPGDRAHASALILTLLQGIGPGLLFFPALQRDLGPRSPWGRVVRRKAELRALLDREIARRRAAPGEDILSLFLQARDEAGAPLSDDELHGEIMTLVPAGYETTATALSWALTWLAAEPAVAERLAAEVDAAGDDPDEIARLPWLNAVCSEALRIVPVFPMVIRTLQRPWRWGAWDLPAGMRVAACIQLAHRRAETWPDPDRFLPERFLGRTYGPCEFLPFGGGARRCVGAAFAQYEMKLVLATLVRELRIGPASPGAPAARQRKLAIAPRDPRVRVVERRGSPSR